MSLLAFAGVLCIVGCAPAAPNNSAGPDRATAMAPAAEGAAEPARAEYRVLQSFDVGGIGNWDYLAVDPEARRLYVTRSTRVLVLDADSGESLGEVAGAEGVHGVALAPALSRGFTSNGRSDSVSVFDMETFKVRESIKAGRSPDAIVYEPVTRRVFVFNARSNNATVIYAEDLTVAKTFSLGGKPEFGVVDGKGKVFVNIENTNEVLRIDAAAMKIEQRMPLAPGVGPTGLAIDPAHHRLFAVCRNELMVIVDSESGGVLATTPIGKGVDGAVFDEATGDVLSANGEDGTITVVATSGEKAFQATQTLTTARSARTLALDPKTRHIFVPSGVFERSVDPSNNQPGPTVLMRPDSFRILVIGR